jgi:conjugal transfer pilus assembly protein TraW
MIQEAHDRHIKRLHNVPTPEGIFPTKKASVRVVDLTYTVTEAVRDEKGVLIVPKGMRINPLQIRPLTKRVFFIHGDNKKHLDYVKANAAHNDRVIALAGSVLRSSTYLDRQVYMDMVGLSKQMKVTAFPSVVSQVGTQLRIEELVL